MSHYVLALGSNLGERQENLLSAVAHLRTLGDISNIAPIVETPPLLPAQAPEEWYHFFLNTTLVLETNLDPEELLSKTQEIETQLGRKKDHQKWAPREIDIDIISSSAHSEYNSEALTLPHPEWHKRSFVTTPLGTTAPELLKHRAAAPVTTALMGIINVTPDSFSQENITINYEALRNQLESLITSPVQYIDIGAESTRPGAQQLSDDEEWQRLQPVLSLLPNLKKKNPFVRVSLDTYHPRTAQRALDYQVDILNDVSGFQSQEMLEVAANYNEVILMHSLSIPADPLVTLPKDHQPVDDIIPWYETKLNQFNRFKTDDKIIFDPGIGFGKTPLQSLQLLQEVDQLMKLPSRLLIGHSRKSFFNLITEKPFAQRDTETLAASIHLAHKNVDILRVHNIEMHLEGLRATAGIER